MKGETRISEQERTRLAKALELGEPAFTIDMFTDQEAFYDERADIYDEQSEIPDRVKRRELINVIYHSKLRNLIAHENLTYLDFGCGTGTATNIFLNELNSYAHVEKGYATDISSKMVDLAKKNLPDFTVFRSTAETLDHPNTFDLITSFFHVLCHLSEDELDLFFRNAHTSLRKGGILCFDVVAQFNVGEHGYASEDLAQNRKYLAYHSTKRDGSKVLTKEGVPMMGTDRMFTKDDILNYARRYDFEPTDISEINVNKIDNGVGIIREWLGILSKS